MASNPSFSLTLDLDVTYSDHSQVSDFELEAQKAKDEFLDTLSAALEDHLRSTSGSLLAGMEITFRGRDQGNTRELNS